LLAQWTPAHGLAATQVKLQAWPAPHAPPHALSAVHLPDAREQYCPDGQVTPLQGWGKQPAMH